MLSENARHKRSSSIWLCLYEKFQNKQIHRESRLVAARRRGERLTGTGLFGVMKCSGITQWSQWHSLVNWTHEFQWWILCYMNYIANKQQKNNNRCPPEIITWSFRDDSVIRKASPRLKETVVDVRWRGACGEHSLSDGESRSGLQSVAAFSGRRAPRATACGAQSSQTLLFQPSEPTLLGYVNTHKKVQIG